MRGINLSLTLLLVLVVGFVVGLLIGVGIGRNLPVMDKLLVYSDGNPNAWQVQGLDEAEKKAHFLIYECDAKMAVVITPEGRLIAQVRKSDGRDIGGPEN
jgi:hypothetical protein